MKKWIVMMAVVGLLGVVTTPGFSQLRKDIGVVRGSIVNVDGLKNSITVRDFRNGSEMTFTLKKDSPSSFTKDMAVIVLYKIGTTVANTVRPIVRK